MFPIDKTKAGLYNGVSQQPPEIRTDEQVESQINNVSSLVYGIYKRNGSRFITGLQNINYTSDVFSHSMVRDGDQRYIVMITKDVTAPIKIYTPEGTPCTVTYEGTTKDYFVSDVPKAAFRAVTVADHTIITNKTKVTQLTADLYRDYESNVAPNVYNTGFIYIKKGYPSTTYSVKINGAVLATFTTDNRVQQTVDATSSTPSTIEDATNWKTDNIAKELYNDLVNNLNSSQWTVTQIGSIILIKRLDGTKQALEAEDSQGNTGSFAALGSLSKYTDLPPEADDNTWLEVKGDIEDNSSYFVKYISKEGVWQETAKGNVQYKLDATTMPHTLVRTGATSFTVKTIEWGIRKVGDENTVPIPRFIGKTINDVVFFRNRFGVLSGESFILSRADDYWNFWAETAFEVLDSDPIERTASTNEVSIFRSVIPYNKQLLVFSDVNQFISSGDPTPKGFKLDPITKFNFNGESDPTRTGASIFFSSNKGAYSAIREYYIQPNTETEDSMDITSHVPAYIPSPVTKMVSTATFDSLFCLTSAAPSKVFVYNFLYSEGKRIQSAWHEWNFDGANIINIDVLDSYLYLITESQGNVSLERINLEKLQTTEEPEIDLTFPILIDRLVYLQGTYSAATGKTSWTLPYSDENLTDFVVVSPVDGSVIEATKISGSIPNATGNYAVTPYYIGKLFTSKTVMSKFLPDTTEGTDVAQLQGKLKVKSFEVAYKDTGQLVVKSESIGRSTTSVDLFGVDTAGVPEIKSRGSLRIYPYTDTENLTLSVENSSHLPSQFFEISYKGNYRLKTKSIR